MKASIIQMFKEDTGILVCILQKEKWNLGNHGGT